MNNFTKCITAIWICSTIAAIGLRDNSPMIIAALLTACMGLGYVLTRPDA